ncbi:MAG: phthalate 4,5-dioxygenase [Chloroflexi bacterium]|nr:phthalate 4,5-dioxygenase [Chloroflexota bacterium]
MLRKEENDLLTHIGPSTPGGAWIRRYWQPAALSEEISIGGAPLPVRLLGEDLVLFRDEAGQPGLLGIHCAHRGADLSYGRIEDGGLRCIYHGWLYDRAGRCLEQPGEPEGSTFHERIRQTAYPCVERSGVVFAYLGPGEPPLVPAYDFLTAPDECVTATKYFQDCNYLQGNEGNFDPQHLSFLHRLLSTSPDDFRNAIHSGDKTPTIDPVETDFGIQLYAVRKVDDQQNFVKVRAFIMPNGSLVDSRGDGCYHSDWHVPIDDTHHWKYSIAYKRSGLDREADLALRKRPAEADYHLKRNRTNRYLQNRDEMRSEVYIGMGRDFIVHDTWATEGEGPIYDRSSEHLGYTDCGIIAMRNLMLGGIRAVQEGRDPLGVVRDPARNSFPDVLARDDMVPSSIPWRFHWRQRATEPAGTSASSARHHVSAVQDAD